ncbi:MAG TPA: serine hydrolase domain-containing protein [Longimicrobium sp.]|jgi:CubicO group peptidase (beta-lactamase class C family)
MTRPVLLLLGGLLLTLPHPGGAEAQDLAAARIDSLLDTRFAAAAAADSPGCQAAVIRRGRLVTQRAYGSANLEHRAPVTAETRFPLLSITKQFTAFAVLLLAQEGKLSLDDDVRRFVPEVPDFGHRVTLRHLLHHTSGLRDYWDLRGFSGERTDDVVTQHDVLQFLSRQRALNFEPGTEHLYNNTGYLLLGIVVKRASGMSLPAFAQARIFGPLGMRNTRFVETRHEVVPRRAYGYARGRGGTLVTAPANDVAGSTGLLSTVEDLAAWDRNFYTGEVGGPGVLAQMRTPARLADGSTAGYGGGLQLAAHRGLRTEEHNGADPGYLAELLRFPDQGLTVAALCSGRAADPIAEAYAVADTLLAGEIAAAAPARAPAVAVRVDPARLASYTGVYHGVSNDLVRRILRHADTLFYARRPGDSTRLVPLAPDRFLLGPESGVEVRFVPARGGGRPEMHVLVPGARPSRYLPVDTARGLPAGLAEYGGLYYSEELQATYRIGVLDGQLHWRIEGLGPEEFSVTYPPRFRDSFGERGVSLTFIRGPRGEVRALELTTDRARRVRFERVRQAPR